MLETKVEKAKVELKVSEFKGYINLFLNKLIHVIAILQPNHIPFTAVSSQRG